MIKGLSRAGIGDVGDIEAFAEKAAKHGFEAIDVSGKELREWAERRGLEAAQETLRKHELRIGSIGLPVEWRADEASFREGLVELARDAKAAAAFGCTACCTYILPSTDQNAAHFMALATRRLRTCAELLGAYGISLGLEFVGPHHLRTRWANPFIWTMEETLDWIAAIDRRNVGLLFDAYHWYTTGGTKEAILSLKAEQIVHVHLNDAKPLPVSEVLDNDRLYPGEGVIDLQGFLQSLNVIGYKGVVAQEILSQQSPPDSSDTLISRSAEGFRHVYRAAGLQ
ncbi:sugar phosphate isomerase/epimerase [Paenibacillus sp. F411]|uniref:Xylose isomerase domain-containing protein n=1 Tax=Paenibacillus algicola TaxID=2565926 RepID=A0A4P8XN63_9BACL|nr:MULTISPECIES: sugar phosphate isomerase/epimerase [Paenibacillus]MBO2946108.1 sugar phosphate isomerase/epimerase [Paenibacillus sp. F411]QCT01749.1 xylose isomerase domain-containing protein [Paenibacillus algicola]